MFPVKIKEVTALENQILRIVFDNGVVKTYDVKQLFDEFPDYQLLMNPDIFNLVKVDCGGRAIAFTDDLDITEYELWTNGKTCLEDEKIIQTSLYKNGQGRYGSKLNIPLAWLKTLGVTQEDQSLKLKFNGDTITIQKL